MSDNWLIFVPKSPEWRPQVSVERAVETVRLAFPSAEEVDAKVHSSVQFIDQGQNFDDVRCPSCKATLMGEFGDLMNDSFDEEAGGFSNLEIRTPCCSASVSLNDLEFEMPAAFGSFQIDVMNPGTAEIPEGLPSALERELGTPVRTVWCHI